MPGFTTHYLFGLNSFRELEEPDLVSCIRKFPHAFCMGLIALPTVSDFRDRIFSFITCRPTFALPEISGSWHTTKIPVFFLSSF